MWQVLSPRPITHPTGEVTPTTDAQGRPSQLKWERVTSWPVLGTAKTYDEARARFGGRPVLEWVGKTH